MAGFNVSIRLLERIIGNSAHCRSGFIKCVGKTNKAFFVDITSELFLKSYTVSTQAGPFSSGKFYHISARYF